MIEIRDEAGVRVLSLARGKGNALDIQLANALLSELRAARAQPDVKAIVFTSASPSIFCGGFDLAALGKADAPSFDAFIRAVETLFFEMYLYEKPVVAALTGHAVAGGLILAGAADFRLAAEGPGRVGLPEAMLGVVVPRFALEALRATLGERAVTRFALGGDLVPFAEAQALGAIDRVVPAAELLPEATALARKLGGSVPEVYGAIKRDLRGAAAERAMAGLEAGREAFTRSWFSEAGQKGIASALSRLAAPAASASKT